MIALRLLPKPLAKCASANHGRTYEPTKIRRAPIKGRWIVEFESGRHESITDDELRRIVADGLRALEGSK